MTIVEWLALGVGIVVAALAAAGQTALTAANRVRVRALIESGGRREDEVAELLEGHAKLELGLPVLEALGFVVATTSAVALVQRGPRLTSTQGLAAIAGFALFAVVAGRLLPMVWSARDPDAAVLSVARQLKWLSPLVVPASAAVSAVGRLTGTDLAEIARSLREDELRALVNVDEENGKIEKEEMAMIAGIIELGDTKVREVMVPRIDIVSMPMEAKLETALDTILRAGHSRIPVYRQSIDDIAGLLYAKDLLKPFGERDFAPDLGTLLRTAYFVPESKPVDELLHELQKRKVHMAIVVDEYGGTAGLVTIEDLLEEIVGEIQDEYDAEEPRIEQISDSEVLFDAGVDIDDVNRLMDIDLPTDEVDTLAGLVFTSLGKVPEVGERALFDEAEIEVLALTGRRIRRVRVARRHDGGEDGSDDGVAQAAPRT